MFGGKGKSASPFWGQQATVCKPHGPKEAHCFINCSRIAETQSKKCQSSRLAPNLNYNLSDLLMRAGKAQLLGKLH